MKKRRCRTGLLAGFFLLSTPLILGACGGDGTYTPDPTKLGVDEVQKMSYPSGPYGKTAGDIIEHIQFASALMDPDTWCKDSDKLDVKRSTGARTLSLLEIAQGSPFCPQKKKQFLWMAITAGW